VAAMADSMATFLGKHQWKLRIAGIAAFSFPFYLTVMLLFDDACLLYRLGVSSLVSVLQLQLKHCTADAMVSEVLEPVIQEGGPRAERESSTEDD
jgi:hypothetical protein